MALTTLLSKFKPDMNSHSTALLQKLCLFILFNALFLLPANSQSHNHDAHEGHSPVGWVPAEVFERPVTRREGIGKIHEPVSTSSKQAQVFYDQGLSYLQSYVWIEAARSFHQALRSDPKLAMAYVGLSYAYSPMDFAAATQALQKASSLASDLPARELHRIKIRDLQLKAMLNSSSPEAFTAFKQALDDALVEFPSDEQFLLLRGNAEEPNPFGNGQGCVVSASPYYEKVVASNPENFAANHFLIHCYENSGRPEIAVKFAREYVRLAPAIPHAHHMYGHVLRRVGEMTAAIDEFRAADALEAAYFKTNNFEPSIDWHYAHNLGLLASSYQYLGKMKEAEKYYRQAGSLRAHSDYDAFNRKDMCEFLLDRGRYPEALVTARALSNSPFALARVAGHSLVGIALLGMNKSTEVATELNLSEKELSSLPPAVAASARLYVALLRAQILLMAHDSEAQPLLQRIAARIRADNGPDAWIQGLYELERINRAARGVGDWETAAQFAKLMEERAPQYPGSHYALALSAQHDGDTQRAKTEFSFAAEGWSHADANLPELSDIRKAGIPVRISASIPAKSDSGKSVAPSGL